MDKLELYYRVFGERFPLAEVMGLSKAKVEQIIDRCIKEKKKYKSKDLVY